MRARKYPRWAPPAAFIVLLIVAMLLSNQRPVLPNGDTAITSDAQFQKDKAKLAELSLQRLHDIDAGKAPTEDDLKKLREAGEIVDRMNAYLPTVSGHYFIGAKIHFALKEDAIAEEMFRQCTLLAPAEAKGNLKDAAVITQTAAEANYQLSLLLVIRRDLPGALAAADEAVKTVPESSLYHTARGSALNELRRTDEAKAELQLALKLDPNNPRAKTLLKFISENP